MAANLRVRRSAVAARGSDRSRATERRLTPNEPVAVNPLAALQRTIGNGAVGRLMGAQAQRAPDVKGNADPPIYATIKLGRTGKVEGDGKDPGYEGKLAVLSMNFVTRTGPDVRKGPGRDEQEQPPTQLLIEKNLDRASTTLAKALIDGDPVESAEFEYVARDADGRLSTRFKLAFKDGALTSYQTGSGDTGRPSETIGAEFGKREHGPSGVQEEY